MKIRGLLLGVILALAPVGLSACGVECDDDATGSTVSATLADGCGDDEDDD